MNGLLKQPNPILYLADHAVSYPTPSNISYMWNFGSLAAVCLVVQLITGIFLAMHYGACRLCLCFCRAYYARCLYDDLLRYTHANGASMFFHCCVRPRIPRTVLWIVSIAPSGCLTDWSWNYASDDGNSLPRICSSLRTDELLRSDSNYELILSLPLCRTDNCWMNVRRILCW